MSCAEYAQQLEADAAAKRRLAEWRVENGRADERFRELMRSEMRTGATKPCPRCKQAITKSGGCHHHVCTSCKVRFCWQCGAYNAARPSAHVCGTTCSKPARTWWTERELLGAPAPSGATSASASDAGAGSSAPGAAARLRGADNREGCVVS
jgi:hypothetical protein